MQRRTDDAWQRDEEWHVYGNILMDAHDFATRVFVVCLAD